MTSRESGLAETSVEFDIEDLPRLLTRVVALIDHGLDDDEVRRIMEMTRLLEVEDETTLGFDVQHREGEMPLVIRVRMDDVDLPAVHFFSHPELIAAIDAEIRSTLGPNDS